VVGHELTFGAVAVPNDSEITEVATLLLPDMAGREPNMNE
jgi:hypothetical protein